MSFFQTQNHAREVAAEEREARRVAVGASAMGAWTATGRGLFQYRTSTVRLRVAEAMSRIASLVRREPTVDELSRAVLDASWLSDPPSDARRRARLASFAPRLTARAGAINPFGNGSWNRVLFPDPTFEGEAPAPVVYDQSREQLSWQVWLFWSASRWVFDPQSIEASRTFRLTERLRSRLLRRVVNVYETRRRLQTALLLSPPSDLRHAAMQALRIDELTGVLDGLSNGYFSSALAANDPPALARAP